MCSSGEVTIDLIADELQARWESQIEEEDEHTSDSDDEDSDDGYDDYESGSEDIDPRALQPRESTPFVEDGNQYRDILRSLRVAGRDFLVINEDRLDTQ